MIKCLHIYFLNHPLACMNHSELFAGFLYFFIGSRYGSPRFLSGEPELGLTTLSGELVLKLTAPEGFTTKITKFSFNSLVGNPAGVVSSNTSSPLSLVSPDSGSALKKRGEP